MTHTVQSKGRHPSPPQSQVDGWHVPQTGFSTSHPAPHTELVKCVNCWAGRLQHWRTAHCLSPPLPGAPHPSGNFSLGSSLGRHREHTVAGALWLHRVFSVSMVFFRGGDEAEAAVVPAAAASSQPSFPLRGLLVERAPRCRGRTEQ